MTSAFFTFLLKSHHRLYIIEIIVVFQPLSREVTQFKPKVDEMMDCGKSLDALIQSAETVVTNRRRSTHVARGDVARTDRRVVEIQQNFQVTEGE